MRLLLAKDFSLSVGGQFLFHLEQLNIHSGERVALVGANASGKSSFLRALMAPEQEDLAVSGLLQREGLWSCFEQRAEADVVVDSREQLSCWNLSAVAERRSGPCSGGEAVRLRLAEALARPHDFLLLDEPTAHLDQAGLAELRRQLAREESFLLISHDRALLNEFCERTLVIREQELLDFPGTYEAWRRWEESFRLGQMRDYEQAVQEKRRLIEVAAEQKRRAERTQRKPRNRTSSEAKAQDFCAVGKSIGGKQKSLSAAAKNTEKRIERLGEIKKPLSLPKIRPNFALTNPPENKIIVEIEDLSFAYPGQVRLFEHLSFALRHNTRTALLGENGSGKSTLLRLIAARHEGIRVVPKAKLGFFEQGFESLRPEKTILENVRANSIQDESVNRNVLARMGFPEGVLGKRAAVLSGGELCKLCFAKLFVADVNVLLIDEPSNYLDIPSYEAIEELLRDFEGTLLFCTHDQTFLQELAEEAWLLEAGRLRQVEL